MVLIDFLTGYIPGNQESVRRWRAILVFTRLHILPVRSVFRIVLPRPYPPYGFMLAGFGLFD
jgi:hypothetical protein